MISSSWTLDTNIDQRKKDRGLGIQKSVSMYIHHVISISLEIKRIIVDRCPFDGEV